MRPIETIRDKLDHCRTDEGKLRVVCAAVCLAGPANANEYLYNLLLEHDYRKTGLVILDLLANAMRKQINTSHLEDDHSFNSVGYITTIKQTINDRIATNFVRKGICGLPRNFSPSK